MIPEWPDEEAQDPPEKSVTKLGGYYCNFDSLFPKNTPPDQIFVRLTKILQRYFPIQKGMLVLTDKTQTRYVVTATFNDGSSRQNLSLWLPGQSSIVEMVAENRTTYTEDFVSLFTGNVFERNLLLGPESQSFVLQPLIHDADIVGVIGYSSDQPMAFVTFEEGLLKDIVRQLSSRISQFNAVHQ